MSKQSATNIFNKIRKTIISELKEGTLGTLHEESKESLKELAKINELGFLTHDSQQGIISYGKIPDDPIKFAKIISKYDSKYRSKFLENDEEIEMDYDEAVTEKAIKEYESMGGKFQKGVVSKERAYLNGFMDNVSAYWLTNMLNQDNLVAWYTTKRYRTNR